MKILCRFIFPTTRLGAESQFSDFLDGLGPGQLVGRQTLATPPMGESSGSARGAPEGREGGERGRVALPGAPSQHIPVRAWLGNAVPHTGERAGIRAGHPRDAAAPLFPGASFSWGFLFLRFPFPEASFSRGFLSRASRNQNSHLLSHFSL